MKKIIGIFVCMLLIATALPAVGTMNENTVQDLELRLDSQRVGFSSTIPDDEYFDQQWSLHNTGQTGGIPDCDVDAPEAWDKEIGNSDVIIAIIDTGVDYTHPDIAENMWINEDEIPGNGIDDDDNGYIDDVRGWNFYDDDNDPLDLNGHGTICAGIAGAVTDNGIGIAGVCWDCQIISLKVCGLYNTEDLPNLWIEAIEYAVDNGADIISMSFGIEYYHQQLENAVDYAYNNGVFLTASAGNQGWSNKHYPAAYNNVIGVAATNDTDGRMENAGQWGATSNYGPWVDVAAPGEDIFSTMPSYHVTLNDYGFTYKYTGGLCGTSCSAPHVAGLAALLLSTNPSLSPDDLKALICDEDNVDPYNSTYDLGSGRINAYKALIVLKKPDAPTITGPSSGKPNIAYDFTFNAVDPDGDDVKYIINWGDGDSDTTAFAASGTDVTVSHTWDATATFTIKAKAEDTTGLIGPEASKTVNMLSVLCYMLYQGWNLVTVPTVNEWTAETLGQNITGCTVVTRFDGDTQTFTTHVVWTPHDNFPIVNGESYFIYCSHDTNLTITGPPLGTTTVHIYQEWNLIGWYTGIPTTAESLGTNITDCSVVTKFDGDTQTFTTHVVWTPHDNFSITQGMGLFIYATSESDWHGEG